MDEEDLVNLVKAIRNHDTRTAWHSAGVLNAPAINEFPNKREDLQMTWANQTAQYVKRGEWKRAEQEALKLCKLIIGTTIGDYELHHIAHTAQTDPTKAMQELYSPDQTTTFVGIIVRRHHVCNSGYAVRHIKKTVQDLTDTPDFLNFDDRMNQIVSYYAPLYLKIMKSSRAYYLTDGKSYKPVTTQAVVGIVKDVLKYKHSDPVKLEPLIKWQSHRLLVSQNS